MSDHVDLQRLHLTAAGQPHADIWAALGTTERRRRLATFRRSLHALDDAGLFIVATGRRRGSVHIAMKPAAPDDGLAVEHVAPLAATRDAITAALSSPDVTRADCHLLAAILADLTFAGRIDTDLDTASLATAAGVDQHHVGNRLRRLAEAGAIQYAPGRGGRRSAVSLEVKSPAPRLNSPESDPMSPESDSKSPESRLKSPGWSARSTTPKEPIDPKGSTVPKGPAVRHFGRQTPASRRPSGPSARSTTRRPSRPDRTRQEDDVLRQMPAGELPR